MSEKKKLDNSPNVLSKKSTDIIYFYRQKFFWRLWHANYRKSLSKEIYFQTHYAHK